MNSRRARFSRRACRRTRIGGVSTPRGARGAPKAKPPRPSRAVAKGGHVECGEGRARPRDVSMLQGTSPPPRLAVVQNAAFSRENHRGGGRVRFPRDASPRDGPTSPDDPRSPARGSPGAHARTRAEPRRPPSPPAAAPPTRQVADRASSIRNALSSSLSSSHGIASSSFAFVFPSHQTFFTRDKLHYATDMTRRTPTGRWCARRAPRPRSARGGGRSSGSAARTSARARTWRARLDAAKRCEKKGSPKSNSNARVWKSDGRYSPRSVNPSNALASTMPPARH